MRVRITHRLGNFEWELPPLEELTSRRLEVFERTLSVYANMLQKEIEKETTNDPSHHAPHRGGKPTEEVA